MRMNLSLGVILCGSPCFWIQCGLIAFDQVPRFGAKVAGMIGNEAGGDTTYIEIKSRPQPSLNVAKFI